MALTALSIHRMFSKLRLLLRWLTVFLLKGCEGLPDV